MHATLHNSPKPSTLLALVFAALASSPSCAIDSSSATQALIQKTKSNLVFVKGGTFKMGDFGPITTPDKLPYTSQDESKPLHDVELDSFSIGKYKVTYEDFDVYTAATGKQKIGKLALNEKYRAVPNVPAGVNWQEAKDYCAWLAKVTALPFDLPTEAQWEYAARSSGKYLAWATDNGRYEEGRNVASYEQRQEMMKDDSTPRVYPVGKFPPNPLGLYDMSSNGSDWVNDWFAPDYYERSPRKNPSGPDRGTEKVMRGLEGDYATAVTMYRQKSAPQVKKRYIDNELVSDRYPDIGFRCVLNSPKAIH